MSEQMPEPNTTIANIGDLAKPIDTLIAKFADATGAVFLPWQIKRIARAEAEAETIKAVAAVTRDDMVRRTATRLLAEESIKQANMDSIFHKAIPEIQDNAEPAKIENDWALKFQREAKLVSDEDMQAIWASILAGEANRPGSFSKRTIDLLSQMDKSDAHLFTDLNNFCVDTGLEGGVIPLVYNSTDDVYRSRNINWSNLLHLETIGLIDVEATGFQAIHLVGSSFHYFTHRADVEIFGTPRQRISFGHVTYTKAGRELSRIVERTEVPGFWGYLLLTWKSRNYAVSEKNDADQLGDE